MATLRDAVRAYLKSPKDPDARATLRRLSDGKAIFKPGQRLDPADVERVHELLDNAGIDRAIKGPLAEYQTFDEMIGAGKKGAEVDPSAEGVPLIDGVSQDAAGVDWSAVPLDRRVLVLHGMDTGAISRSPDPDTRRRWANDLHRQSPLTPTWQGIRAEFDKLRASQKEAFEERLTQKRLEVPVFSDPTPAQMIGQRCAADGHTSCHGNRQPCGVAGMVGDCGRPIPVNPRGPIVIPADGPAVRRALEATFRLDSDFNAFVQDNFPAAHGRFSDGMDRTAKVNLLLRCADPTDIGIALSRRK